MNLPDHESLVVSADPTGVVGHSHAAPAARAETLPARRRSPWVTAVASAVILGGLAAFGLSMLGPAKASPEVPQSPLKTQGAELRIPAGSDAWHYVQFETAALALPLEPLPVAGRIVVDESRTSRVMAPLQGRIESVHVRLGQHVVAGDVLMTVRSGQLVSLLAEEQMAEAAVSAQKRNLARIQSLVELQAAPEKDLIAARQSHEEAHVALEAARMKRSSLRVKELGQGRFELLATKSGVLVSRDVAEGLEVGPDRVEPLMMIADLDQVLAVASVPEADVEGIELDQVARVWQPAQPAQEVTGTVAWVSPLVDPDRHTVDVRVRLDNSNGRMRPNAWVQVAFAPKGAPRLVVPAASVVTDDQRNVVFARLPDATLVRKTVQIGRQRNGRIELLAGLKPGEEIASQGALLLLNAMLLAQ